MTNIVKINTLYSKVNFMSYYTTPSVFEKNLNCGRWGEFSKISKICLIPSFSVLFNKQIYHLKGLDERNKILGSLKYKLREFSKKLIFFTKMKKWLQNHVPIFKPFQMMYFFCSKNLKMKELDGFLKFSKTPPSAHKFENFQKRLANSCSL